jgi:hypothetical protein
MGRRISYSAGLLDGGQLAIAANAPAGQGTWRAFEVKPRYRSECLPQTSGFAAKQS